VRLRAALERRAYTGFGYAAKVERAGRAYRPGVGFELREDFTAGGLKLWQGWEPRTGSPFTRHQVQIGTGAYLRNTDGTVETVEGTVSWAGTFTSGAAFSLGADLTYNDLRKGFALSDAAWVLPGGYTFASAKVGYDTPAGQARSVAFTVGAGQFYDGWRLTMSVAPKWVV
jgi:hypothetical protein